MYNEINLPNQDQKKANEIQNNGKYLISEAKSLLEYSPIKSKLFDLKSKNNETANKIIESEIKSTGKILTFLLEELDLSGKISKSKTKILNFDQSIEENEIYRIGSFNWVGKEYYLLNDNGTDFIKSKIRLDQSRLILPGSEKITLAVLPVDLLIGKVIAKNENSPTILERYHNGGWIGYLITILFLVGIAISISKLKNLYLLKNSLKNYIQQNTKQVIPKELEIIQKAFNEAKNRNIEYLELKIKDGILETTQKLDAGIRSLSVIFSVAPLCGLLGTVLGMIKTFQALSLQSGSKSSLMAVGISEALVTTALGLISAIPLILIHSILSSSSTDIKNILENQSIKILLSVPKKD